MIINPVPKPAPRSRTLRPRFWKRRLRRDAVGGIGGRAISRRGVANMTGRRGGRNDPIYRSIIQATARARPRRPSPTRIADAARQIAETLNLAAIACGLSGLHRTARRTRTAAVTDRRRSRPCGDGTELYRWSGACTASSTRMRAISTTWWTALRTCPRRLRAGGATHHSSWRAYRLGHARRDQIWCALHSWARRGGGLARAVCETADFTTTKSAATRCRHARRRASTISFACGKVAASARE